MSRALAFLARRRKAIVAELALLVTWAQVAYVPDGTVDRAEWVALATVILGGLGVHAVTNVPVTPAVDVLRAALAASKDTHWHDVMVTLPPRPPTVITPQYPPLAVAEPPLPPSETVVPAS